MTCVLLCEGFLSPVPIMYSEDPFSSLLNWWSVLSSGTCIKKFYNIFKFGILRQVC